jgi:hypothetical protein
MDWAAIIERNSVRLLAVIGDLFAMCGVALPGLDSKGASLPRHAYRAALIMLRPAESAVRRLIIIAARGLVIKLRAARAFPAGLALNKGAERVPAFCLIDPLKRFAPEDFEWGKSRVLPRISVPGFLDPVFPPSRPLPGEDGPASADGLRRRLRALKNALEHLPREARRLARWRTRRVLARLSGRKSGRLSPMRPGFAPGYRRRESQEIDSILGDCHYFALQAWGAADTS